MAVKDFNPQSGDATYTMGIVDLLLECVELSYRPGKYRQTLPLRCISSQRRCFEFNIFQCLQIKYPFWSMFWLGSHSILICLGLNALLLCKLNYNSCLGLIF